MIVITVTDIATVQMDLDDGMTAAQVIQAITDENSWRYKGTPTLQETITGRTLSSGEVVADGRTYCMNAWLEGTRIL